MDTINDPNSAVVMLDKLDARLGELYKREQDLQGKINTLQRLGVADVTPHWRKGGYLYLLHPTVNGERQREYIGSNPQRIADAFARIERAKELPVLEAQLADVENAISAVKCYLAQAIAEANRVLVTDQARPGAGSAIRLSPMEQQL